MEIEIVKDFLNKKESDELEKNLTSKVFSWSLMSHCQSIEHKPNADWEHNPPLLRHVLYDSVNDHKSISAPILKNILERIEKEFQNKNLRFIKIAANAMIPNTKHDGYHSPPHIDVSEIPEETYLNTKIYTGIYYVNDCDGETIIYDQTYKDNTKRHSFDPNLTYNVQCKIAPKKGTFAYWDNRIFHSAPASASIIRYVINFNFMVDINEN